MSVLGFNSEIHRRPKALTDVRAKLRRAAHHISEINDYIGFKQGSHHMEIVQAEPCESGIAVQFALPTPIDHDLPMMVGEAIQDLRAGLDYLVYDLSWVGAGKIPEEKTQFPMMIEPPRKSFAEATKTTLKGLSPEHRAKLESLQPYNGCQWTALLALYSNREKHRHSIAVTWSGSCRFEVEAILKHEAQAGEVPSADARRIEVKFRADSRMANCGVGDCAEVRILSMDAQDHSSVCCSAESIDLQISFDGEYNLPDGRPVSDTLALLQGEATKVVGEFEAELQAAGIPFGS